MRSLLVFLAAVAAQWNFLWPPRCPRPALQPDFQPSLYQGYWYEQIRSKFIPYELWDCVLVKYTLNPDGTVGVLNTEFNALTKQVQSIQGLATFNGPQGSVRFFSWTNAGDYRVVATDYTSWAAVYSCSLFLGLFRTETVWILTRERYPSDALLNAAFARLRQDLPHIWIGSTRRTYHGENCRYIADPAAASA